MPATVDVSSETPKESETTSSLRSATRTSSVRNYIGTFQLLFAFRLLNSLSISTFFQPDEFYQALEPAWHFAFGEHSAAWITWEWRQHLRSAIHPALFAMVYKTTSFATSALPLSAPIRADVLVAAPKVLQAFLATVGDYYTWKLAQKVYGDHSRQALAAVMLTVINPWQWFCSTRTFSNCLEMTLTIVALYHWPWDWAVTEADERRSEIEKTGKFEVAGLRKALLCAALATVLRPTTALIWITVASFTLYGIFKTPGWQGEKLVKSSPPAGIAFSGSVRTKALILFREATLCGSVILTISVLVDRAFYGSWTFPPANFLFFNVIQSLAVFYGNNNWHYYISQGYPLLLTTILPYTAMGMIWTLKNTGPTQAFSEYTRTTLKGLAIMCLALPTAFSILSHKEVRFIYPILPALHILSAAPFSDFVNLALSRRQISAEHIRRRRIRNRIILVVSFFTNLVIAIFMSREHNSGLISLPAYLRRRFEAQYLPDGRNMTVAFLMPCHSVPWRSHMQYPATASQPGIQAWALTCEPPLHLTDAAAKKTYMDEADFFYDDPRFWLRKNMARDLPAAQNAHPDRNLRGGIRVADKAVDHRNKKLWSRGIDSNTRPEAGMDITDLLPYLITSPPLSGNESVSFSSSSSINNQTGEADVAAAVVVKRPWPRYLAFFAGLEPTLNSVLSSYGQGPRGGYQEIWRDRNSFFHEDWRRRGPIKVWHLPHQTSSG